MTTNIQIGKTHRSALIASDTPFVGRVGDTVFATFCLDDGRMVRVEMSPDVAEILALSLGRMAKP